MAGSLPWRRRRTRSSTCRYDSDTYAVQLGLYKRWHTCVCFAFTGVRAHSSAPCSSDLHACSKRISSVRTIEPIGDNICLVTFPPVTHFVFLSVQAKAYIDAAKAAAAAASRAVTTTSHFSAAAFRPSGAASPPAARSTARSAASDPIVLPPTEASMATAASGQYAAAALSHLTSLMGEMQGALRRNSVHDRPTAAAVQQTYSSGTSAMVAATPASSAPTAAMAAPASALSFYRSGGIGHSGGSGSGALPLAKEERGERAMTLPGSRRGTVSPRAMFSRLEGAVVSELSEDFSSLGASAGGASFGGASLAQEAAHNAMLASHRWGR